jgi:uncharacterized protein
MYLMIAIGFRGGIELSHQAWSPGIALVVLAGILFSLLMPWLAYAILRWTSRLGATDAAAVAATYGSVSLVTFVTAVAFLVRQDIPFSGHLIAVLALMESPAIVSGIILARRGHRAAGGRPARFAPVLHEALVNGSVVLLLGSLAIGWFTGEQGMDSIGSVFVTPFQAVLAIFLLDMGLIVVRRLKGSRLVDARLVAFGIYMPLIGAALGLVAARSLQLGTGDALLFAILAASASYIAVPAALRHALPEADPSVYVTLSLGVTFPFNIILGIPLYYAVILLLFPG